MIKKIFTALTVSALCYSGVSAAIASPILPSNSDAKIETKEDYSLYLRSMNTSLGQRIYYSFSDTDETSWFDFKKGNICFIASAAGEAPSVNVELIRDTFGPFNQSMGMVSQPVNNGKVYRHTWRNLEAGSYKLRFISDGRIVHGNGILKNC